MPCRRHTSLTGALLLAALAASPGGTADPIYKWRDRGGVWHFSDEVPEGVRAERHRLPPDAPPARAAPAPAEGAPIRRPTPGSGREVILYTTRLCPICDQAEQLLSEQGVRFKRFDIHDNGRGERQFRRLDGRGVPLILVGDARMDGFNRERLMEWLRD